MLQETLKSLFDRDLKRLSREMESYQSENNLWIVDKDISNSAGNLCLHLIGNLNWFIGAQLGESGYIRHRDLEFSSKNVPRTELLQEIDNTRAMIHQSLDKLGDDQLEQEYPLMVLKQKTSTYYFLVHLLTHLSYHLGQINYHRRLLDL